MTAAAKAPKAAAGPSLYEIGARYRTIADQAEQLDGELTPELEAAIGELELAEGEKLDAYASLVKDATARAAAIGAYEKALAAELIAPLTRKRKGLEALAARLKGRVTEYMTEKSVAELGGKIWRFAFARNSAASLVWKVAEVTPEAITTKLAARPAPSPALEDRVKHANEAVAAIDRFTKLVVDEAAVRAAVEAGDPLALELAELVTGRHLRLH